MCVCVCVHILFVLSSFLSLLLSVCFCLWWMKRSTACGSAGKGRRVSSFYVFGAVVQLYNGWIEWLWCMSAVLLHGISDIPTFPRVFSSTRVFVTFRVHFTSVCLHYTHFNYKLSLSGSNTYTVFCFIPLALEVLFHTTTNDSTSNLHLLFSKSCCVVKHVCVQQCFRFPLWLFMLWSWLLFLSGNIDVVFGLWKCF